jgi:FixJ family two-component response regulator
MKAWQGEQCSDIIAADLGITERTVKAHRHSIMTKVQ